MSTIFSLTKSISPLKLGKHTIPNIQFALAFLSHSRINEMRFCLEKYTETCNEAESRAVFRARDRLLNRFPEHHDACIDVATCIADFDSLVRQIQRLSKDDVMPSSPPNPAAVCNRIRQVWNTCLTPGLQLLPQEKVDTAVAMYSSMWAAVEESCQDTST